MYADNPSQSLRKSIFGIGCMPAPSPFAALASVLGAEVVQALEQESAIAKAEVPSRDVALVIAQDRTVRDQVMYAIYGAETGQAIADGFSSSQDALDWFAAMRDEFDLSTLLPQQPILLA